MGVSRKTKAFQIFQKTNISYTLIRTRLIDSIRLPLKEKRNFKRNHALNRGLLLVFLVLYVLTKVGIILNRYFGHLYLKILKKQHSFLYHLLFSRVSKPSSSYSFSLDGLLTASVIASATLYWIGSSFGEMKRYMLDHICHHRRDEV